MGRSVSANAVRNKREPVRVYALLLAGISLFVVLLAVWWGSPQALSVPLLPSAVPTGTQAGATAIPPTVVPSGTPAYLTPIAATQVAYASAVAAHLAALGTAVALTHAPTALPGPPSPVDSPTPMLGLLPGCSNTNAYEPQALSCWRGVVGGQLVDVDAGREGRSGDMTQGIVRVHTQGQQGEDVYNTPSRVGGVRIVSVSGPLFTLSTVDLPTPQMFVFDLDTRQWGTP